MKILDESPLSPAHPRNAERLFSVRAARVLDRVGIADDAPLSEVARLTERCLLGMVGGGRSTVAEIRNVLARAGLDLGHTGPIEPPLPPFGIRDYFAAHALVGMITGGAYCEGERAERSYWYADAMLAERAKPRTA